jgi:DNA-directed RNA polymerase II subunit RPB2
MGKQAQGAHSLDMKDRMDTRSYQLWYPEKPIVTTSLSTILGLDDLAAGMHALTFIMSLDGGNQDDSVIVKRSAIDYALFRSWMNITNSSKERKGIQGTGETIFCNMNEDEVLGRKLGDYDDIDMDGLIRVNARTSGNTILMSKGTRLLKPSRATKRSKEDVDAPLIQFRDSSVVSKMTDPGIVTKVMLTQEEDGCRSAKVTTRTVKYFEEGDKVASRHGQKGTGGAIKNPEDMPFTEEGLIPDILINGLAFTSRMTFGHIIETILAIICCLNGTRADATPFSKNYQKALYDTREERQKLIKNINIQGDLQDALRALGLNPSGNRILYSGVTGEMMRGQICGGMVFYQRLKHMVSDKIRARARGKVHLKNRQPVEGKSKGGGLRLGEMEKDCLLAHGASELARERLFYSSDPCNHLHICRTCKYISIYPEPVNETYCSFCNVWNNSLYVYLPYGFKEWIQELQAVGIALRLKPVLKCGSNNFSLKTQADMQEKDSSLRARRVAKLTENVTVYEPVYGGSKKAK